MRWSIRILAKTRKVCPLRIISKISTIIYVFVAIQQREVGLTMNIINAEGISMKYRTVVEKVDSLKQYFIKKIKNEIRYKNFYAIHDVSFSVSKGEVFGIIGLNGAGKSTLLKIVSGVLKPTAGSLNISGSIAPLLELESGFNPELSGIENIYLNGLILGYSRKFIHSKIEEIIEFSEIREFIFTPLKNYSSGMKSRLGFAIATIVKPDILIVDEVLSIGDLKFGRKSEKKILSMVEQGTTVLFVSHSLEQVKEICDRVLWLDKGKVVQLGDATQVCNGFEGNIEV